MKAAWYEKQGAARDVLVVGEMDDPQPRAGEVRIRIAFSGVNPGDVKKREDAFGVGMPYETMFACCCVGAGNTTDISAPKTVENIVHLVNQFPQTGYKSERIVETLEGLVRVGLLLNIGDRYQRPPYVCSRDIRGMIPGQPDKKVMAIVQLRARQDVDLNGFQRCTLLWEFMIPPTLCEDYNDRVNELLQADFEDDLMQARGSLKALKKLIKAYKRIDLPVQTATGLIGTFGIAGKQQS
jgi:hypothetical protein